MGRIRLPMPANFSGTWGEFFGECRVLPCLKPARDNGSLSAGDIRTIERMTQKIIDGDFNSSQPTLLAPDQPARIHGDLWSGNVMWSDGLPKWAPPEAGQGPAAADITGTNQENETEGLPTATAPELGVVGVLIDPAAQGGHAETDLAYLEIFGQPYLDKIYAGYNSVSQLEPGYQQRMGVHQMHMLAVHAAIFGGDYGRATVITALKYL